jgi:hypothetical protein
VLEGISNQSLDQVVWLAPSIELVNQAKETFKALWGRVSDAWKSAPPEGGTATRVGGTPEPRVESATDESRN